MNIRPSWPVLVGLSEFGDVLGQGVFRRDFFLALHHPANLLDHVGIRERRDVADVLPVRNRSQDAAHDLPGARLGHVGHDIHIFRSRDLADQILVRLDHAFDDLLTGLIAGLERDIDLGHAPLELVGDRDRRGFGDFWHRQARGLDLLGAEAMAGDVDDIVNAAQDAEVAIRSQHGAVARQIGPIAPVLALAVLAIALVILTHEPFGVAPDRLHDPGPRIADADVARTARARGNLFAVFVVDDRVDSRHPRPCAAGFHRIDGGHRAAEESAVLGLPPRVYD